MNTLITAAVLLCTAAITAQDAGAGGGPQGTADAQAQRPSLDNTRWSLTATPGALNKKDAGTDGRVVDALLFGSGTVTSRMQMLKGFTASPYTLTQKDGKWLLAARQVSPKAGEITWNCVVAADSISGTMLVRNKAGAEESFQLTGIRAPALEGTSWRIKVTETDREAAKPREDTMLFVAHKMTSKDARAKGFPMCSFSLVPDENGAWVLGAVQRNAKDKTRMVWTGAVKENTIQGTVTMLDPEGEVSSENEFEGSKTDKPVRIKQRDGKSKKKTGKK